MKANGVEYPAYFAGVPVCTPQSAAKFIDDGVRLLPEEWFRDRWVLTAVEWIQKELPEQSRDEFGRGVMSAMETLLEDGSVPCWRKTIGLRDVIIHLSQYYHISARTAVSRVLDCLADDPDRVIKLSGELLIDDYRGAELVDVVNSAGALSIGRLDVIFGADSMTRATLVAFLRGRVALVSSDVIAALLSVGRGDELIDALEMALDRHGDVLRRGIETVVAPGQRLNRAQYRRIVSRYADSVRPELEVALSTSISANGFEDLAGTGVDPIPDVRRYVLADSIAFNEPSSLRDDIRKFGLVWDPELTEFRLRGP